MRKGRSVPAQPPRQVPEEIQSQIALSPGITAEAQKQAMLELSNGRSPQQVIGLAEHASDFADLLARDLAADEPVACRAGCSWCCTTTHVATSAPEILRIADALRRQMAPTELARLIERLNRRANRIAEMPEERRPRARIPCALLIDHRCSIYDVRPLACKGWTSSSAQACESSYRSGWERAIPNGARRLGISVSVRQGVREALDQGGLDGAKLDLTVALRIALSEPDTAERWLAGEPVFALAYVP